MCVCTYIYICIYIYITYLHSGDHVIHSGLGCLIARGRGYWGTVPSVGVYLRVELGFVTALTGAVWRLAG